MQTTWLLHRDILHAITTPVAELHKEASAIAAAALCSQVPEELEVAFKGEARFAFLWLQCFITEEDDWCHTRGCPACDTLQTLSTELTIRGTITAALLSARDDEVPDTPSSESESQADEQPTLPDFSIILGALEQAMAVDSFWGPGHYAPILTRSKRIVVGIQELMSQCQILESLVSSTPPSPGDMNLRRGHTIYMLAPGESSKEIKLKKGAVARRQAKLKDEQGAMIMRMALQTWSAVHLSQRQRSKIKAAAQKGDVAGRKRTFTT
jgi:hypothetical protein